MGLPEHYRFLRRKLVMRLLVSAGIFAVVVSLILVLPREADEPLRRSSHPVANVSGSLAGAREHPGPVAAPPGIGTDGAATLADVMRAESALEPLPGKVFEVFGTRSTEEAAAIADAAPREAVQPSKLPRGPHLQAGIFTSAANAEDLGRKLEAAGYPVYIETRVNIGPFRSRKEADKARERLGEQGTPTLYVPQ